jgi:hypothetical protein
MTAKAFSPTTPSPSAAEVLSTRALNRATLARQFLLERSTGSAAATIEHLGGMQAQAPDAPYVGLWTRLHDFRHKELISLTERREVVRVHVMRCTIHLLTARDCLAVRPLFDDLLASRWASSEFARDIAGVDVDELCELGRKLLEERPRTRNELGEPLAERWPGYPLASLAYTVNFLVPAVQLPPRGVWGRTATPSWTTVESWLGEPLSERPSRDELVLRYLGAFGPASVKDAQAWSGLTKLREVFERLDLRRFRDERGMELFDLPDAPRPNPQTPAPPRFLPEYDNLLLSHADRRRVIPPGRPRVPLPPGNGGSRGTLLVDGMWRATWQITRADGTATLTVEPFEPLSPADEAAVTEEGRSLLAFAAGDAEKIDVRFA